MKPEHPGFVSPVLSRSEVGVHLSQSGWWGRHKKPEQVELVYLPHFLFTFCVQSSQFQEEHLAVDAISGDVAYQAVECWQKEPVQPATILPFYLSEATCRSFAEDHLKRVLLQVSLKENRMWHIKEVHHHGGVYFPFWIGYFRRKKGIAVEVVDAINGRPQGPGVRQSILRGLADLSSPESKHVIHGKV